MLQLKNSTPFAADMALFPNEQGVDTLYLIVKASFKIGKQWVLADEQTPPITADEYWGEPNESSLKYASDFHIGKPATDIIMLGSAYSQNNQPVDQLDVSLSVGQVNKTVRVFGDRVWIEGQITAPKPFHTMPLVYEKAFGGQYIVEEQLQSIEEKNPVGCGYAGKRSVNEMNGISLPNLEDPQCLIRQYNDQPDPACFALSAPAWQPRVSYAGTYDETWETQRAPYLPDDFDKRFLNMAHNNLIYPGYLQGGESVKISNMHAGGEIQFNLPHINLVSQIELQDKSEHPKFNLETLLLEPNQLQLSMVWRAALPCDKKILKISEATIGLSR